MSNTSHINAINLQVFAEDQADIDRADGTYSDNKSGFDNYYLWHGEQQTIPMGMDGEPEIFAARLKEALPGVNTLRLPFNEYSFNEDGSLHPEYERFLAAAANEGFQIIFGYFGGEAQGYGFGEDLTGEEMYEGLDGEVFDGMVSGWTSMTEWLDEHPDVQDAVYGYELVNEPAAYERGARVAGDTPEAEAEFVALYVEHMEALTDLISPENGEKILVGGWKYSAKFDVLDETLVDGVSALDHLRAHIGEDLVWSAHNYPGWHNSSGSSDEDDYVELLEDLYGMLGDDDLIITELHVQGPRVDEVSEIGDPQWLASRTYEWYAENGIGGAWFPGAETGASNLVVIDAANDDGNIRYLHPGSLGHGLNFFSLDENPVEHEGDEVVMTDVVEAKMRNEEEIVDGSPQKTFDDIDGVGFGYGYGGNDTITGHDRVNDYAYGGQGDDVISGLGADDYLFGQYGNDTLLGGSGEDMLFGGDGDDRLAGGEDLNHLEGASGADTFVIGTGGHDVLRDYDHEEGDIIELDGQVISPEELLLLGTAIDYQGTGVTRDFLITHADGGTTVILNYLDLKAGEVFDPDLLAPIEGDILQGTSDADTLEGTDDPDTLVGDDGADVLSGGNGDDFIYGESGRDSIFGGDGNDVLIGGDDNDEITDMSGANWIHGGAGNERIKIGGEGSTIDAGIGNDRIIVTVQDGANHFLTGNEGRDRFELSVSGGVASGRTEITDFVDGVDTLMINGPAVDLEDLPEGMILTHVEGGRLLTFEEGYEVFLRDIPLPPEPVALDYEGTQEDDVISRYLDQTTDLGDTISTFDGADAIFAGSGDNTIYAGDGRDTIDSGGGDDFIDAGTDNDEVSSGGGDDVIFGGSGNDRIIPGTGANVVDAGSGNDRLIVSKDTEGDDLTGGTGSDRFEISLGEETAGVVHVVRDFATDEDTLYINGTVIDIENLPEGVSLSVEGLNSIISFNEGGEILLEGVIPMNVPRSVTTGTDEADIVSITSQYVRYDAGFGDDRVNGSEFDDEIYGEAGRDRLEGRGGDDLLSGGDGNDILIGGDGDDELLGGSGNDRLQFESGTNTGDAGQGNDRLQVSMGDGALNEITGGEGKDSFEFTSSDGESTTHITDFAIGTDALLVDGVEIDLTDLQSFTVSAQGDAYEIQVGDDAIILDNMVVPEVVETPVAGQVLQGSSEGDVLYGDAGDDVIYGGEGDDDLRGGEGADILYGEDGKDTIDVRSAQNDVAWAGSGNDRLMASGGRSALHGEAGNDRIILTPEEDMFIFATGGSGKDDFEIGQTGETFESAILVIGDFEYGQDEIERDGASIDIHNAGEGTEVWEDADGFHLVFEDGFEVILNSDYIWG